jgi:DNA-binding transcriptional LysR family regulator
MDATAGRSLELRHLQALRAVADTGTFGRAAELLGFSQSAVSQQIAALERTIAQPVFERHRGPRPVTLTPAGALLLERATEILERLEVTMVDLEPLRRGERGPVALGTFQSVSQRLVPRMVGRLHRERPGVDVSLYETEDQEELLGELATGGLDLAFLVGGPGAGELVNGATSAPGDLELDELFREPYMVLTPSAEPDGPFPAAELARRPLIGQHDTICQRLVDDSLRANGVEPGYAFHTVDNGAVHAMVGNGMGLAVMARLAVDDDDPAVRARPLHPPIPDRRVLLGWRAGSTNPLIGALVELAHSVVAELGFDRRG